MTKRTLCLLDLKPCAHCGGDAALFRSHEDGHVCWHIECIDCGVRTMSYEEDFKLQREHDVNETFDNVIDAMDLAIESATVMWNSRDGIVATHGDDAEASAESSATGDNAEPSATRKDVPHCTGLLSCLNDSIDKLNELCHMAYRASHGGDDYDG